MSEINIEKFKNAWFSFEEINKLILSEEKINEWKIISQEEMNIFIQKELFSKCKIDA